MNARIRITSIRRTDKCHRHNLPFAVEAVVLGFKQIRIDLKCPEISCPVRKTIFRTYVVYKDKDNKGKEGRRYDKEKRTT
jgi:hypothetical protein